MRVFLVQSAVLCVPCVMDSKAAFVMRLHENQIDVRERAEARRSKPELLSNSSDVMLTFTVH